MALTITQKAIRALRARGVKVLSRAQWGSTRGRTYAARRKTKPAPQRAGTVVQHITVTKAPGKTLKAFRAACRAIEQIGWARFKSGVSYNFLVHMQTGWVAAGQPLDAQGTHTVNVKGVPGYEYNQNRRARAIAVIGGPGDKLSDKAVDSIVALLVTLVEVGAISRDFNYDPHSLFAFKDCPCDATRDRMPEIRRRVQAELEALDAKKSKPVTRKK